MTTETNTVARSNLSLRIYKRNVFEVPLVVYTTPEFRSAHPETYSYILRRAGEPFSLHDISAFLLHIGGVRSRFAATAGF